MENENAYANHGIIIMIAYVNGVKLYRVYKEGNIRAEVIRRIRSKKNSRLIKIREMKDPEKYEQRVLKGIIEKLGENANIEDEFNTILEGKSKLTFRERQYIVWLVARQTYLKQQADDSVEGEVE
jgi:hypothetical protein